MSKIDKNSKLFIVYNGYLAERRQPMKRIDKVMEVIGFIEDNLTEKLELDEIAEEVHYSKYHLHRVFSDTVGLTIHEYIKRRQLTEAAKLLVFSDRPIIEIALLAGYKSQQAFTTIFTDMYKICLLYTSPSPRD